jgi:hypothetical protein
MNILKVSNWSNENVEISSEKEETNFVIKKR